MHRVHFVSARRLKLTVECLTGTTYVVKFASMYYTATRSTNSLVSVDGVLWMVLQYYTWYNIHLHLGTSW